MCLHTMQQLQHEEIKQEIPSFSLLIVKVHSLLQHINDSSETTSALRYQTFQVGVKESGLKSLLIRNFLVIISVWFFVLIQVLLFFKKKKKSVYFQCQQTLQQKKRHLQMLSFKCQLLISTFCRRESTVKLMLACSERHVRLSKDRKRIQWFLS